MITITTKNMEKGLVLLDLFKNDFQEFERQVDKLSDKDKEQIRWWWEKCFDYIKDTRSVERFMN